MTTITYRCPWCQQSGSARPHNLYHCFDCAVTFYAWATQGGAFLLLVRSRGSGQPWHIETADDQEERVTRRAAGINANPHGAVREALVVAVTDSPEALAALTPASLVSTAPVRVEQGQLTF